MQHTHTPGPWVDGNTSDSIIAPNAATQPRQPGEPPDADVTYYGGYVVAETVSPRNKPLIKAAPLLLAAAAEAVQAYDQEQGTHVKESMEALRAAIAAAELPS